MKLNEQVLELRRLKESYRDLSKQADEAKAKHDQLQHKLIEMFQGLGVESIRVDGTLFVPSVTHYGSIQDRDAFTEWAELEMPELLEPRERKQLLNEMVRDKIEANEELPPGVGSYPREVISQRVA